MKKTMIIFAALIVGILIGFVIRTTPVETTKEYVSGYYNDEGLGVYEIKVSKNIFKETLSSEVTKVDNTDDQEM